MKPIPLNDADRRALNHEPDTDAIDEFRALAAEMLEREIQLAKLLLRIHLKAAFADAKCSSVADLAARSKIDPFRARDLFRLGYALAGHPLIEVWLREGTVSFAHAFLFGDLYRAEANPDLPPVFDPDDLEDEEKWLHVMLEQPVVDSSAWARSARRSASTSSPSAKGGRRPGPGRRRSPMTSPCRNSRSGQAALGKVDRARELANQTTDKKLSNAQLLNLILTSFLLDNEERWKEGRERQMPDTNLRPNERGIPADVKRAIWDRSDGVHDQQPSVSSARAWSPTTSTAT